jgi:glycosyltransferase involved in cell wall biosynthesis
MPKNTTKKTKARTKTKLNIVCLSNQSWDLENWTNNKHVMTRLASAGHSVLFVNPPQRFIGVLWKYVKQGIWKLPRLLLQAKKDPTGARIFSPSIVFSSTRFTALVHVLKIVLLGKFFFAKDRKKVLWVYNVELPHLKTYLKLIPHDILVYDCVDNYIALPIYDSPEKKKVVQNAEQFLTESADVIFATSPGLADKLQRHNTNVVFAPNAGDYSRFKNAKKSKYKLPENIAAIPSPRVGFVGVIDAYKFDFDLMKRLINDHPKKSFVFVGSPAEKGVSTMLVPPGSEISNVYFLETPSVEELPKYYAGFDAYIIPYVLNDYTVGGCFPIGFHDALAVGLAPVVTDLPAYAPFKGSAHIAKDNDEFSMFIDTALAEDNVKEVKGRQLVAKENSWEVRVARMLKIIHAEVQK